VTFALVGACANLDGSADGTGGDAGTCESIDSEKTKSIRLACTSDIGPGVAGFPWELTVDPGPILSGEEFGASFSGVAEFRELWLDNAQSWELPPNGFKRIEFVQLHATVHVRIGATGRDVVLAAGSLPKTCTYDGDGNTGVEGSSFPPCSEENDNPDGSNDDCTGLGGTPRPEDRCAKFVSIPFSDDCSPGGACDTLDGGFGLKTVQCVANGFCVTGPLRVPLQLDGNVGGYRAEASGSVVFGWDDQSTGAELDETGAWVLPPAVFEEDTGPNGFRAYFEGVPVAHECTMAKIEDVTIGGELIRRQVPTPDSSLIAFSICER